MVSDSFKSPNSIPPRKSSSGLGTIGGSSGHVNPAQPVLKPVAEGSWMSHGKKPSAASSSLTPPDPNSSAENIARHVNGTTWSREKEMIVMGPYEYLLNSPGKDIRKQLIEAFNAWLKVPAESLAIITNVVGMLHTASLLIDDVEDSSILRRGLPVAHSIFGMAQTINSANYIYFAALHELLKLENPTVIKLYSDELCNLHRGQGMDLFWRDTLTCPSEDDYLEMVGNKTGGLFRLAVQLMQAESSNEKWVLPPYTSERALADKTFQALRTPSEHDRAPLPDPRRLHEPLQQRVHG